MIEQEVPPCPLGIETATLSALRDEALPRAELRQLREHIATCAACQERLAGFERVARALRRQPELEPGDRIWLAVEEHAMNTPVSRGQRRHGIAFARVSPSTLRGLAAVASLALVVGLLAIVLATAAGNRPGSTGNPTQVATTSQGTATTSTTATTSPAASPSATTLPTSGAISPEQAWGANAATLTLNTKIDTTRYFETFGILPDGSSLLGDRVTIASGNAANAGEGGLFDLSSRTFTSIGLSQTPSYGVGCCTSEGRYLLVSYDTAPGATCGLCHKTYYAYDLETKALWQFAKGTDDSMVERVILDHGIVVMSTGQGIYEVDLAAHRITQLHLPVADQSRAQIFAYSWPYLVYTVPGSAGSGNPVSVRARDLATNQDVALPQVSATLPTGGASLASTGDTLFIASTASDKGVQHDVTTLYEDDAFFSSNAAPRALASFADDLWISGANDRVVTFGPGMVWDRAEQRFVALDGSGTASGQITEALAGNYLAVVNPGAPAAGPSAAPGPQQVTIYDTSKLRTTPGA